MSSRGQAGDADAQSESEGGGGQDSFKEGFHCRSPQNCFDEEKVAEGYWDGCARAHRARKNPPASSSVSGGSCGAMVG